jgi:hypothetical protein
VQGIERQAAAKTGRVLALHCPEPVRALRTMLCIDVFSGYAKFTVGHGFITAYDRGEFNAAPIGSVVIADSLVDPDRGVLLAELTRRGWEIR